MALLAPRKNWKIKPADIRLQRTLSRDMNISLLMAQLLLNRNVKDATEASQFLSCSLSHLFDPLMMQDMSKAITRVKRALQKKEKILIFGDYDVDGVTSIAILQRVLEQMGADVCHHIPHRVHDGYGLNNMVARIARQKGASLFISVDCGITAIHEVDLLTKAGIDVIVIDHHEPSANGLPSALAVIDPKRKDDRYPFKELAAVGLVYKFIQALTGSLNEDLLDFVALGTVADVVPLISENRILVKYGLERIKNTKSVGLAALMEAAKLKPTSISPQAIGFILGPRLNATGRIDSARKSLELLLCNNELQAAQMAQNLNSLNNDRQKLQRQIIQEAVGIVDKEVNFKNDKVIVVSKDGWHKGVLGIVASRVCEMYSRPAVVISLENGVGSASARSISGFHLSEALNHCAALLEEFGGHKLAAGLTIRAENIMTFRRHINDFAKDILKVKDLVPVIDVDCEVPLSVLNQNLFKMTESLQPFGEGNPVPLFCTRQLKIKARPVRRAKETLKLWLTDGTMTISAVGFGMAACADYLAPGHEVDVVYQLSLDTWGKAPTLQLKLKDIKTSTV